MLRTRTPLSLSRKTNTARLACVRPPASVHPEPGSNSPLYVCLTHSKKIDALVFPYFFGCYLYVNDLFSFRLYPETLSVVCSELRVQKYKIFLNWPNVFEKNLKLLFRKLYSLVNQSVLISTPLPLLSIWDCKSINLFLKDQIFEAFFFETFLSPFRYSLNLLIFYFAPASLDLGLQR